MKLRWLALTLLFLGVATHAQILGADPVTIIISPQYPEPYDTITITPQSTITNLAGSSVTISVNEKVLTNGSGGASASYQVGGAGETDTITVSVSSPDGHFQKSVTVRPESIALVEEPISTTHAFYLGGDLVAPRGDVRFITIPSFRASPTGSLVSASNLIYTWKIGDQVLQDSSGIGKSTLDVASPVLYRNSPLTVTVTSQDGTLGATAHAVVAPVVPQILLYQNDPLLGPDFDRALGTSFTMQGAEHSFRAVPYFFPTQPALAWSVNGSTNGTDPVITVRTTGPGAGSAVLTAQATQPNSYTNAITSLTINFGGTQSSPNIFGL